jgi:hypothetical protein
VEKIEILFHLQVICTSLNNQQSFKVIMSRNNNRQAPAKKPFCKVCFDAGKPESDYTGHYVRSQPDRQGNSNVTCPTLLNTECRYCYGLGHTAKFCPVLGEKKQREERRQKDDDRRQREEENRIREEKKQQMQPKKQDLRGGFSALIDNSDDEQEVAPKKQVKQEEWPLLGNPSAKVSYASMANKTQPIKKSEPVAEELPSGFKVLQMGAKYEKTEVAVKKQYDPKSWARDDSDDEDEDW